MISIPNCTIIHNTKVTTIDSYDPITGEPVFTRSESSDGFRASLERETVEPSLGNLPGKDKTKQFYTGKSSLKPSEMPAWYKPGAQLTIQFDNGYVGNGYVYFANPSRLGLDDVFGAPIEIALNF